MIKKILRLNRFTSFILESYFFFKKHLIPKGWFESRYLHQPLDENKKPIPWFTYSSIHFISKKLKIRPMTVFEYGSGNSTLWFSSRVEKIISIENDMIFYKKMQNEMDAQKNITYKLKSIENNYASQILKYKDTFDILIIDGRERVQCVKNCFSALKKDGIIIFDNSDRAKYNEAYDLIEKNKFKKIEFKGLGPVSHIEWQTTIFYRENNCFKI
jgi:precorrin-6B methylase 2